MARIRQKQNGKWQVLFVDPATGKERALGVVARKSDATQWRKSIEREVEYGEFIDPDLKNTAYRDWAERWMGTRTELAPKTFAGYESLMRSRILPTFGDSRLGRIMTIDIAEWVSTMNDEGLSPSRVHQAYHLFSSSLAAAVLSGFIRTNPATGIRLPKMEQREMLFLSSRELIRLSDEIDEQYTALLYVLGFCGLRAGEAAALRRSSVNLMRSELRVTESVTDVNGKLLFGPTKTKQARTVAMPTKVRDVLEQHMNSFTAAAPDALVFTSPRGMTFRLSQFRRRVWAPAVARAGLPKGLRIHDMRHTAASLLINTGATIKSVQEHLGHSSVTVTIDRYAHLYPETRRKVAAALDDLIADVLDADNRTESNRTGPEPDQPRFLNRSS